MRSVEGRTFEPFGAALALMYNKAPEVLLSGPAGTGKSRAVLEKIFLCAEKYAGMRALIIRKTRASLTESQLVTWEQKVVPPGHPCLSGAQRKQRQAYLFPNGSQVAVGGMDEPTRILSTEWDIIYVPEAIELTEEEWETLTTRLRNGVLPYQQMLADTNPDGPRHWLYLRCQAGKTVMLESRHEDNPTVWDRIRQCYTKLGEAYISKLDALTGVRFQRFRLGRWVQAEGIVYGDWEPAVHRIHRHQLPVGWEQFRRIWVVDFGYSNPFVWHEWVIGPDGDMYRTREIYRSRRIVEDHAADMLADSGWRMERGADGQPTGRRIATRKNPDPLPEALVCDHDAEGRATLERHLGMQTQAAFKAISDGIQAVQTRLHVQVRGSGEPRPKMYFVRDACIHPVDEELVSKKLPVSTEEEFDGYVWDTSNKRKKGETPVDLNNHGMDTTRYAVAYADRVEAGVGSWAHNPNLLDELAKMMGG